MIPKTTIDPLNVIQNWIGENLQIKTTRYCWVPRIGWFHENDYLRLEAEYKNSSEIRVLGDQIEITILPWDGKIKHFQINLHDPDCFKMLGETILGEM